LKDALKKQIDGDHYVSMKIQPVEFIVANNLCYRTGNVIKYVVRQKGDAIKRYGDLHKARHYLDMLIEDARHEMAQRVAEGVASEMDERQMVDSGDPNGGGMEVHRLEGQDDLVQDGRDGRHV